MKKERNIVTQYLNSIDFFENPLTFGVLQGNGVVTSMPSSLKKLLRKKKMSYVAFSNLMLSLKSAEINNVWDSICARYTAKYVDRNFLHSCNLASFNIHINRLRTYGYYIWDRDNKIPTPPFSSEENINLVKTMIDYIRDMEFEEMDDFNAIAHGFLLGLLFLDKE